MFFWSFHLIRVSYLLATIKNHSVFGFYFIYFPNGPKQIEYICIYIQYIINMSANRKYDVFVSYRRSSSDSANLIATTLRSKGYRVFFDVESLRGGKFNEQLYDVIDNCTDFLLVLPENALERCYDEEDWVRKEVLRALAGKRNIIPIMLAGFAWPQVMPPGLEELRFYQALTASSNELFPLSMDKLANSLMKSRRHKPLPRIAKVSGIITLSVVVLILSIAIVLRFLSLPLCDRVSDTLIHHAGLLDDLGKYENSLKEGWDSFYSSMSTTPSYEGRYRTYQNFTLLLDNLEAELNRDMPVDTLDFTFSGFESILLAARNINATDLESAPSIIAGNFRDLKSTIGSIRLILQNGMMTEANIVNIKYALDIFPHSLRLSYFYYLACMTNMPSSAMESCDELSKGFRYLPSAHDIHSEDGTYMDVIDKENYIIEGLLTQAESVLNESSSIPGYVDERLANLNYFLNSATELEEVRKANEAEIAAHKEKIAMMKAANDARKQKLAELDNELEAVYEDLKNQCTIDEKDGKWYKWGKIVKFAEYMGDMCQRRAAAEAQGIHSTSSISPEVLYAFLSSQLNAFKEYHPESSMMVESAKLFYKEVSKGKRSLKGVIIAEIKDGVKHPVFQSGDIIVSFNGQDVENYEQLKQINKKDGTKPMVTFLRLEEDGFREIHSKDCRPIDILGFTSLNNK